MIQNTKEELFAQQTEWERNFCSGNSKRLYKYRCDIYRDLFALQNNLVYIPSREQLNDPNESCLNLSEVYSVIHSHENQNPPEHGESLEDGIRKWLRILGFFQCVKVPTKSVCGRIMQMAIKDFVLNMM